MSPSRLVVRPALPDDLERITELHSIAFPDPRGHNARTKNFTSNPLGDFDDLRVIVDGDELVGHAFLFRLECAFGGVWVKSAGVASVGVSPLARGKGVARTLLSSLHEEANARGDSVSVLYPFRQGFYAAQGYAPASPYRSLRFAPAAIPDDWRRQAQNEVRAAREGERSAILDCYERAALRGTGMIRRPPSMWDALFSDERTVFSVVGNGAGNKRVLGYVRWSLAQDEPHAKTTLRVSEVCADSAEVRRALVGFLGCFRDQVHEISLDLAENDPLDRALLDADRLGHGTSLIEHSLGTLATGPMVRVLSTERALLARGYLKGGTVALDVSGHALTLESKDGRARVVPGSNAAKIVTTEKGLSAIAFGALAAHDAEALGWLTREGDPRAHDELFSLPPYFSNDAF